MTEWPERPRALIAYPYARTLNADAWRRFEGHELVLDSGAFTAYQNGEPIDLDAYTQFCHDHRHRFRFAFALDVIGDHKQSLANYRTQRSQLGDDYPLVPTWHTSPDYRQFEELADLTDYVAIGGAVAYRNRRNALGRIVLGAHRIAQRKKTRLHALGMSGQVATRFPWESADSASWKIPQRRPLTYLASRDGTMASYKYGEPITAERAAIVRAYGGNPNAMSVYGFSSAKHVGADVARSRTEWAVTAAVRAYMWMETAKRRRDRSSFRMFLATGSPNERIIAAHNLGRPRWRL